MPRRRKPATNAELAVLKILWKRGALTARAISSAMYAAVAASEVAAVHSLLSRLERKGLIARDRSSFVHLFTAAASLGDIAARDFDVIAARLGERAFGPLVIHLIKQNRLSEDEIEEIRKLLSQYSK